MAKPDTIKSKEEQPKKLKRKQILFLNAYKDIGRVNKAAEKAKMHRNEHYTWMKEDANYKEAFESLHMFYVGLLEDEAYRRGIQGIEKPLTHQGQLTGAAVREYSDTLLIFLLKGNAPEKYRERHEISGNAQEPLTIKVVYDD